MESKTQKCPVCGKPLTQEEYDKALGIWKAKHDEIKHLEEKQEDLKHQTALLKKEKAETRRIAKIALAEQKQKFIAELRQKRETMKEEFGKKLDSQIIKGVAKGVAKQSRELKKKEVEYSRAKNKMGQLENSLKIALTQKEKGDQEIKRLREQMEKGITPQIEGLLEEGKLLEKLKELFPHDHFDHTGKGGDIIQTVIEQGNPVGKIVYECKKVKSFSQSHVQQAADAREFRQANFAVLVTNAFPAKRQSYFVSNTVFVISPINVEPVTYVLRQSLVRIALLRLSNTEKARAVNEVYKYLSGNEYSDKVNGMAYQLLVLAGDLKSEIHSHHQTWKKRYSTYKNLYTDINTLDSRLKTLLALGGNKETQKLTAGQQKTYPPIEELDKK
jgi:hypothetical protein